MFHCYEYVDGVLLRWVKFLFNIYIFYIMWDIYQAYRQFLCVFVRLLIEDSFEISSFVDILDVSSYTAPELLAFNFCHFLSALVAQLNVNKLYKKSKNSKKNSKWSMQKSKIQKHKKTVKNVKNCVDISRSNLTCLY